MEENAACKAYDIACQWAWIQDEIKAFFVWIFEQIFQGLLAVLEAIPLPSWAQNIGSLSLPSEVVWFAGAFELHTGASIIGSAYLIRFLVRRIPLIG
jgi:hypothetical protein